MIMHELQGISLHEINMTVFPSKYSFHIIHHIIFHLHISLIGIYDAFVIFFGVNNE